MIFASPWLLLLLLAVPVAAAGYLRPRRKGAVLFSSTGNLRGIKPSLRHRLRWIPPVLRLLGLALIVAALARPQKGQESIVVSSEGIAIQMVVDISGSMMAEDLAKDKSRLDVVKQVFEDFVLGENNSAGRVNDVIGMVTFARYPDARCPLTLDHGVLMQLIDDTEIVKQEDEDGTAIGEALALAIERMKDTEAKSKVIILLTDGMNNRGVNPLEVAPVAKTFGIKIYAIGAGTRGLAPFPVMTRSGERVLRPVRVEIDERTLTAIAEETGGKYFRATDSTSLQKVYEEIDKLEKTRTESVKYLDFTELFGYFLFPGLALILLEHLLACTWFRSVP